MSIANLIRRLRDAGAPDEAIQIAVEAVEAEHAKYEAAEIARAVAEEARRASQRQRTILYRSRGGGSIDAELRASVFARDGHACVYCGSQQAPLHCDHVMPISQGGETSFDNLATACATCNTSKGGRTPQEWRRAWL